jgi:hypothetical protein
MGRVVYVHIGAPKTGTTYLQDRLDLNTRSLQERDIHFPSGPLGLQSSHAHFKAALDLMGMDWGGPPGHAEGQWDALARRVRRLSGTVVISHEILAAATAPQIARAMGDLSSSEVHLVYSARDLARQVPAMWQESIKQGRRWSYRRFRRSLRDSRTAPFWSSQDLPAVLGRWSAGLPPERVHLLTVPQADAPPDLLWRRFCTVLGVDPAWAPEQSDRTNPSLGVVEAALVRRLNRRLKGSRMDREERRALVKEVLVQRHLATRPPAHRLTLPPRWHPWAREVTDTWVDWVEGSGIDVVGDVAELYPVDDPARPWVNPDRPNPRKLAEVTLDALAVMTAEAASRTPDDQQLTQRVGRAVRRVTGQ